MGTDFNDRYSKYKAKSRVLSELEMATGKELSKAQAVLSSIVLGLKDEPGFIETSILSDSNRRRLSAIEASITSANKIIFGMAKLINLGTAKVLAAVTAVLLPSTCFGEGADVSRRDFCELIGINCNSKYFEFAVEKRKQYDSFLNLEGDISVGEKVSCRASPEAVVTAIKTNGSVTVKLLPFENERKFKSISAGRIRQYEPDLDLYERETRFDTTHVYVTRTIEDFYCRHVPISPNKSDIVKRRPPLVSRSV